MKLTSRLYRFIVGLDQACNPLIYGGSEDVTLSAQSAYNELILGKSKFWRKAIDKIFLVLCGEKNHCYESLLAELDEFPDAHIIEAILGEYGVAAK
jgi:hypothetical protein